MDFMGCMVGMVKIRRIWKEEFYLFYLEKELCVSNTPWW